MNRKIILLLTLLIVAQSSFSEEIVTLKNGKKAVLYDDHTWSEVSNTKLSSEELIKKNKKFLRPGISASDKDILIACEMYEQGWTYTMPVPKSSKAAWGVTDGRTTWYSGWWYNSKTDKYSDTTPRKSSNGLYLGDGQNSANTWSRGGSPSRPDIYMFLLYWFSVNKTNPAKKNLK